MRPLTTLGREPSCGLDLSVGEGGGRGGSSGMMGVVVEWW